MPTRGLFLTEDGGATLDSRDRPRDHLHGRDRRHDQQDRTPTSCSRRRGTRSVTRSRASTARTPTSTARSTAATRGPTCTAPRCRRARRTRPLQTPDNLVGRMGVDFSDTRPEPRVPDLQHRARQLQRLLHERRCGRHVDARSAPTSGGTLQSISGGFAWWFGRVYVDPVNPLHVFVAGVNLAESLNGGATWTTSRRGARRPARHRVGPVHAEQGLPRQRRRLLLVAR